MKRWLVVFEDAGWRGLRPLTDLTPVPALVFGASNLTRRWLRATALPLLAIEARPRALAAWVDVEPVTPGGASAEDEVLAVNAAALPGPWLEAVNVPGNPTCFRAGARIAAIRLPFTRLQPALGSGAGFAAALATLGLPEVAVDALVLSRPWELIESNSDAIADDLAEMSGEQRGEVHRLASLEASERIRIAPGASVGPFAVLDARGGPILVRDGAQIGPHTVVTGPCVVGAGTELLGGSVTRSTIGPQCRIAGEVEECVWQGYANKRHHGFVGHSWIGEWANLGALTSTSDLKNNYGHVRVWVDGEEIDSGRTKIGSLIGAHVKTGIGTLLPTGASLGVASNLVGGGQFAPKRVPPFGWWDGERMMEYALEKFLLTARTVMSRRARALLPADEALLRAAFADSAPERAGR